MPTKSKFVPRTLQLGSHCLVIVFAMSTFIPLGQLFYKYDYRCILNSRLELSVAVNGTRTSVNIQGDTSEWGNRGLCFYTVFLAVFVFIHAVIWGWFYIHLIRTLKETGREMGLFVPSFITHAILCVCSFVSSIMLSVSSNRLCSSLEIVPDNTYSCSALSGMSWHSDLEPTKESPSPFFRLTVAQVSSWAMTLFVGVPCGVAIYHLFASAPIEYQVTQRSNNYGVNGPFSNSALHEEILSESYTSDAEKKGDCLI